MSASDHPNPNDLTSASVHQHAPDRRFTHGDIVTVFGFRPGSGRPYIRGKAEIISPTWQDNYYRVQFFGERVPRVEFVHPDYQTGDPQRHLQLLTELWHTSQFPDFDNFFPDLSV